MCKAWQLIFSCFSLCALVKRCLLLKIMNDDFGDVRFPLDDNQIEQMQPKIEDANRAFWKNKGAEAEFRGAVTNFLITNLDASGHVFEGIDQS